jgi:hypothetical protein
MPRYSGGAKSAGAGSTTLPLMSLYAAASVGGALREVGIWNTTDTACDLKLVRLTTAGTQGSGLVEAKYVQDSAAASCTLFNTHTVAPTLGDDLGYRVTLGAAKGSGVIFTFGDDGIRIPTGTANGVGIIVENGTGQIVQAYFCWDE